ncbi:Hypothetical predicted protein [Mytilus galloprovincialis]|uniref:Vertnin n=2 Tax=Mytilus galloprovincialis TaxID=29158 RepID=A0A8B6C4R9_MYTGA|nr:Hypothetical predicted protein [Mytilus galloprovincialis]
MLDKQRNKKKNAENCKRWRDQRKNDPTFRQIQAERKKEERKSRTPAQVERDRSTARERMRRYREKQKSKETEKENLQLTCILTRSQKEKQRGKWRDAKRNYRAKLGPQKKRRIRERDRISKVEKQKKMEPKEGSETNDAFVDDDYTHAAKRKAFSRLKKKMPSEPKKFVSLIQTCILKATPRKRKLFSDSHLTPSKKARLDFLEESMVSLKQNLDIQKSSNARKYKRKRKLIVSGLSRSLRKYKKIKTMSKELGIRYCTMLKWSRESNSDSERKKRKDALSIESTQKVRDFFVKPYISVNNPEKRKVGKDLKPKHFLNVCKKTAYQTFKNENKNVKVSESKFWALKPKHVVPLKKGKFRSCLCEKCINVELKLKALNNKVIANKNPSKQSIKTVANKYEANKLTMCEVSKGEDPKLQCIQRKCQTCGVKQLENHFHELGVIANTDETVNWYQWETKKITEPKVSTRKVLASKSTYVKDLLQNLTEDMTEFSIHLFLANWQYRQFSNLKENIPANIMVCIMDFAENFCTRYQDECQSAHWCYEQITIHPIVCYYSDNLGRTVTHEVVYISDDLTHDANFVDYCFKNCINFLHTNLSLNRLNQCLQFTDGCSSQYKSKVPFFDISSYAEELDGIKVERHFFGSGHGKGPADGCSGVVKSAITRGIIAGNVLSSAEDIFSFVTSDLTKDADTFKRTFLLIDKKDVPRSRPLRNEAVTVPGTRQFHCVKAVAQGLIKTRRVSCTCVVCLDIEQGTCINNNYVDEWVEQTLTNDLRKLNQKSKSKKRKVGKRKETLTNMESALNHETVETHEECQNKETHDTEIIETHEEPQIVKSLDESQIVETHKEPHTEETHEEWQIIDTHQEPGRTIEPIIEISVDNDMRKTVFQYIYDDFQNASSFEELQLICTRHTDLIDEIPFLGSSCHSVISTAKTVDKLSLDIWPQDEPQKHILKYPVCVKGDGNCLPRAGSVLANGNEESHLEVRTRMVIEIVTHEDVYLDEYYLNRGTTGEDKHIVNNLVMYSDSYIAGDRITPAVARRILREDTFNFAKLGAYGNAWLIFALSSILKCSLFAIYPQKGNPVVRSHLNREVCPRMTKSSDVVYLMWTSTRTKEMRDEHWIPNHFVPVLPLQSNDQEKGDNSLVENSHDSSTSIDFDFDSFSLCSLEMLVNPIDIDLMQPDPLTEVHPEVDLMQPDLLTEVHPEVDLIQPDPLTEVHPEVDLIQPDPLTEVHPEVDLMQPDPMTEVHPEVDLMQPDPMTEVHPEVDLIQPDPLTEVHPEVDLIQPDLLTEVHPEVDLIQPDLLTEVHQEVKSVSEGGIDRQIARLLIGHGYYTLRKRKAIFGWLMKLPLPVLLRTLCRTCLLLTFRCLVEVWVTSFVIFQMDQGRQRRLLINKILGSYCTVFFMLPVFTQKPHLGITMALSVILR